MIPPDPYHSSIYETLERMQSFLPMDLADRFRSRSGLDVSSFHEIGMGVHRTITGVDGSNVLIAEGGSFSVAAIRAGQSTFRGGNCSRSLTPIRLSLIGPEIENSDFPSLYHQYFHADPLTPLSNEDPHGASAVIRDTLEYWVALRMAETAEPESLLLLDGALRVSHASHNPILQNIISTAESRCIHLAAVAKRTQATWGGGFPLIPAVEGLASQVGIHAPWWIPIDPKLLDHTQFRQWQHGDLYVVRLHPRAGITLKLELPSDQDEHSVQQMMAALVGCANDGRVLGYPYPLLDAHRMVVIDQSAADCIRQDLLLGMAGRGYDYSHYRQLFGDVHDEFRKY
jgi:hypothetical protein